MQVPDRPFNDLRYPLDCKRLVALGWTEGTSWADGLAATIAWYRRYSGNWADVESALVAHPRRGALAKAFEGVDESPEDSVSVRLRQRESVDAVAKGAGAAH